MLVSVHETVSISITKASQEIKFCLTCRCLPLPRRTGHTITERFRPSGSNENVKHKKLSRATMKEIKKPILSQKSDFTCC